MAMKDFDVEMMSMERLKERRAELIRTKETARREHEEQVRRHLRKLEDYDRKLELLESLIRRKENGGGRSAMLNGHANGFETPDPESDDEDVFSTPQPLRQRRNHQYYEDQDGEEDEDEYKDGYSDADEEDYGNGGRHGRLHQDQEEDEEDEDPGDNWRAGSTRRADRALVPREVAVRQQRAAATVSAPPGFESPADTSESTRLADKSAVAPPPGFEKRSPPGFSRTRPANGVKEDRGLAQLPHTDLRNLLSRNRSAASPRPLLDSDGEARGDEAEQPRRLQTPAGAPQPTDLREQLNRRRMGSQAPTQNGHASENGGAHFGALFPAPTKAAEEQPPMPPPRPKGQREWDAGKREFGAELSPPLPPPERAQRSGRQEMSVYQAPRRERFADEGMRGDSPEQGASRRTSQGLDIGRDDSEYTAPDPTEDSVVRFDEFPGLSIANKRPEWAGDASKMEESFPALGAGPASAPKGAWGSGDAVSRLNKIAVQAGMKPEPPKFDAVAFEQSAGLRPPSDNLTDVERRQQMRSKKDFFFEDTVKMRGGSQMVNVVQGLELHKGLLNEREQAHIVAAIEAWAEAGRAGELRGRTFSAPRKSKRGKGRQTIQFGCCYNYATDSNQRPPGIIAEEVVEPMPPLLMALVHRLVRWGVLPRAKAPDTAIINIYDVDDCIPPHIDHHDFTRPFCTISLLSEQPIMFGGRLFPVDPDNQPGVFGGRHCKISLPTGSCLVLKGNGADVAMHCVPCVSQRRMSITLRKMGDEHAVRVKAEAERTAKKPSNRWADDYE
ncbi:probable RNA demethylase ALKBH5 at C-terminar half [Coccomyxa sp. Obi]|nr:probable RNA demethylase ALKBH5 at C-terminar half [Coccomyxa sp. Obi]